MVVDILKSPWKEVKQLYGHYTILENIPYFAIFISVTGNYFEGANSTSDTPDVVRNDILKRA